MHRWVVERSHAWFNRARRCPSRYERRADIYEAFHLLQASLITLPRSGGSVRRLLDSPGASDVGEKRVVADAPLHIIS